MEFNEFIEIAKARQSCRNYDKDKVVEVEKLKSCLEAMKLSPSACNAQPYYYYIVSGDDAKYISKYFQKGKMNSFTDNVNAFAIVTEENYNLSAKIGSKVKDQDYKSIDIGISAAYFTAQATTLGLSTCCIGWFDEEKLQKFLKTKNRIRLAIAIGYPKNDELREKKRKTADALYTIINEEVELK
ncbi:MAG: nitroreductase family protein [Peptoniphilus lacydonensis]|uniref:nitroreductase family protein n=1 Tax=Peptoniphilus lacydonensis TaxID=1673725 RepID=UPI00258FF1E2|nr:nitroreductase family protein [Peptoniphilus lacydonensis]MDU7302185.1 nitroreductase family protein [Peptoniphilus lacydonensis]